MNSKIPINQQRKANNYWENKVFIVPLFIVQNQIKNTIIQHSGKTIGSIAKMFHPSDNVSELNNYSMSFIDWTGYGVGSI